MGTPEVAKQDHSNDHELAIAGVVDRIAIEGRLYPTAIDEVITALDFLMSRSDTEFLVSYIRWRMDTPIAKQAGQ
jgi:hypothetical protein